MASINENTSAIEKNFSNLSVNKTKDNNKNEEKHDTTNGFKPHLFGFEVRELYKIAFNFYKGLIYRFTSFCLFYK